MARVTKYLEKLKTFSESISLKACVANSAPATNAQQYVSHNGGHFVATNYATFRLGSCAEADELTAKAKQLGGRIIKAPYPNYYGQCQAVLADREDNMFRLSFLGLHEGVRAPKLVL